MAEAESDNDEDVQENAKNGRRKMVIGKIVNETASDSSEGENDEKVTPCSKSRDLPARRVSSVSPPAIDRLTLAKQNKRTLATMVDQQDDMPGKMRKSNSENRRPPASQSEKRSHSSNRGSIHGQQKWSTEVEAAKDSAIEKEVTRDKSGVQNKGFGVKIVPEGLPEEIDFMKDSPCIANLISSSSSTSAQPVLSSSSPPPVPDDPHHYRHPHPTPCLCSAELPIIKSSLSFINEKLTVLTGLVLNLLSTRQETALDDLTHHDAAHEDLAATAPDYKLLLAKHQNTKPSCKEFALNRNCLDLEVKLSDDGDEEDMEDISLEAITSVVEDDVMDSDDQMMMKRLHENKADGIEKAHLDCREEKIKSVINNDMEAARRAALEDSDEDVDDGLNPWNDSSAEDEYERQVDDSSQGSGIKTRRNKSGGEESTAMEMDRLCNLGNLSNRGVEGRVIAEPKSSMRGKRQKTKSRQLPDLSTVSSGSEADSGDDMDEVSDYDDSVIGGGKIELGERMAEVESSGDDKDGTDDEYLESSDGEGISTDEATSCFEEKYSMSSSGRSLKVTESNCLEEVDAVSPRKSRGRRRKILENLLRFPLTESDVDEDVQEKANNDRRKML